MNRWFTPLRTPSLAPWVAMVLLVLAAACRGGSGGPSPSPAEAPPVIASVSPLQGPPGTKVILSGRNLDATAGVLFRDGVAAPFTTDSPTQVTTFVPPGAATGPIRITSAAGPSASQIFTVTAAPASAPTVIGFVPTSGPAFTQVTFAGTGFTGVTGVAFGGVPAVIFRVVTDLVLEAVVPSGAVSGPITLTHPAGNVTTQGRFTLGAGDLPAFGISRISPVSGPPGTAVRLMGFGFDSVRTVAFGATAAPFQVLDSKTLVVTVPAGAVSGPIIATDFQERTATSSSAFTVNADPLGVPTITSIVPGAGIPGTLVRVQGQHLDGVRFATLGGRPAQFVFSNSGEVYVYVPIQEPVSGPIALNLAGGPAATGADVTVASPTDFTVTFPAPTLTWFYPASGTAGTQVSLWGSGLASPSAVLFGGTPATSIISSSSSVIQVLVPAGAPTGPITVRTAGGEVLSAQPFQVTAAHSTLNLAIAGLYVTQATQRLDRSVPLVAGRPGQLRVFLQANLPNTLKPTVRVTLTDPAGATLITQDIPAPGTGVPTTLDEFSPTGSWDLNLPGELIRPGSRVLARILPLGGPGGDVNLTGDVFPQDGVPLPLDVQEVAPMGITLLPVNQAGKVGVVTSANRSAASWVAELKEMYPLKDIDLRVAPVFNYDGAITDAGSYIGLLEALEAARLAADPASRRYYYGVVTLPPASTDFGVGARKVTPWTVPLRIAAGSDGTQVDSPYTYSETFAHEVGHNLGRRHAPCGGPMNTDANYPYPGASLGAAGMNLSTGARFLGGALDKDIMSYCIPYWVSDYTYRGILGARATEPMVLPAAPAAAQKGLLVWGRVVDGVVTLEPALEVEGALETPEAGPFTLVLRDAAGSVLQTQAFGATPLEDDPSDQDPEIFAFTLPLSPETEASLASLEVQGTAGAEALATLAERRLPALGAQLPRDPVAVAWKPGVVHLGWDAGTHPLVLVRNAATGDIIGIVRGGGADLVTDAEELDLTLSAGARSVAFRARVAP